MSSSLENFVVTHPDVTLSHTEYGEHYFLGGAVNISTAPTQRLRNFVDHDGSPHRFFVVGELSTFKVIEDSVS